MLQSLNVNGKEYLLSSALAATSGYTSDYLGKLARDEKILGTLIGRQWFIEPESLNVFLNKTRIEKDIRKTELSRERKIALQSHQKAAPVQAVSNSNSIAFGQTFAVLLCGFFVGGLSWIFIASGVSTRQVAYATSQSFDLIFESVVPKSIRATSHVDPDDSLASSAEVVVHRIAATQKSPEIFEIFPITPLFENSSSSPLENRSVNESVEFSDEVKIYVDSDGQKFIKPIFKNKASSTVLFLVTPVKQTEQEDEKSKSNGVN